MEAYLFVKTLHILSSAILFGSGLGIAFFMWRSIFAPDLREKYYAARNTVTADYWFTLPAVIVQPVTGAWLVWSSGFNWLDSWLLYTYALYLVAGLCWLPVVWIQLSLKKILHGCITSQAALPERYHRLFRLWFILGWPAFISLLLVFFLMVFKPL